jgi:hypothetical protein
MQLDCNLNLKFEKLKFGRDIQKQVTRGSKPIDLSLPSIALMGHCEQVIIVTNYNATTLQLEIRNLKYEKLKFGHDMQKQITCDNKSINLPLYINNPCVLMVIIKKFKMNY